MARRSKAERAALNRQIEALCEAKGWTFRPWEWPRPWHDGLDGAPHPDDDENTQKARRLRAQLIAEIEAEKRGHNPEGACGEHLRDDG